MPKPSVKIENVVASVTLGQPINLSKTAELISTVEYEPEQFPGLVYRLSKPKTATLIFSSGKMVCTGAKSEEDVKKTVKQIVSALENKGIIKDAKPDYKIQNVVASANLYAEINLESLALLLDNVLYEPEQFPGLIYRMSDPKVVLLIFSSGKMVCTGAKREEEVRQAVEKIYAKLADLDVMKTS
ncbi:TATA-box-binding protein [Candidatus Marsarchaeota G2 archaeon OSP_D]|uniref:TATA-box-binding protein n=5 Tax=Candidatus Marsarchaeota group 2 TaxID=2203771 RepID=A0A2R6C4P4_9ARCH|nr:MAG: TATA-box-binding protein [Candidatus Marsarchaeota G2 archaeon OSP_D]PSN96316.1 MAG: TATA-box-binding protein [Candidatus Marsarchaeota G2 archaeon ECH_B_2]PSN96527.1 MAG: TATA-box-binding protein [Candidatus Marsarchaeota G2 archaeon ECH_B_SAG-C16]PSO02893.1 MAG: TATA-box-binding protein [Candidatus Marsarchaeota G2 archaeon ECH_B_1]PSO05875.1 MAG: TATA-box-binding protein [Candidatus Marsarchaeota G2 archaeon BE_D]